MKKFVSGTSIKVDELHNAMRLAFSDYIVPMQPDRDQFLFMLKQRGYAPEFSCAVLQDGEIVAFWLIGADQKDRAYVIATGTIPAYRGRGLALKAFENVTALLSAYGRNTLELEVIETNRSAINLYQKLGFEPVRALDCYLLVQNTALRPECPTIVRLDRFPDEINDMADFEPTWQNNAEALARIDTDVEKYGVVAEGQTVAAAAFISSTRTLAQIVVHPEHRRQGLATALVHHLQGMGAVRVLNADRRDIGFKALMAALNAQLTSGQHLMVRSQNLGRGQIKS